MLRYVQDVHAQKIPRNAAAKVGISDGPRKIHPKRRLWRVGHSSRPEKQLNSPHMHFQTESPTMLHKMMKTSICMYVLLPRPSKYGVGDAGLVPAAVVCRAAVKHATGLIDRVPLAHPFGNSLVSVTLLNYVVQSGLLKGCLQRRVFSVNQLVKTLLPSAYKPTQLLLGARPGIPVCLFTGYTASSESFPPMTRRCAPIHRPPRYLKTASCRFTLAQGPQPGFAMRQSLPCALAQYINEDFCIRHSLSLQDTGVLTGAI